MKVEEKMIEFEGYIAQNNADINSSHFEIIKAHNYEYSNKELLGPVKKYKFTALEIKND